MWTTGELEQEIREASSPAVLSSWELDMPPLPNYLGGLLQARGWTVRDVVVRCNLDRSYTYQLFNGTRRPTRQFLLLLALRLGLEEAEAQRLLKIAGREPLYARNRWDAALLYALSHHLTAEAADSLLRQQGLEGLL